MVILGIDPGSRYGGHGTIEIQGRKLFYRSSGILSYNTSGNFLNRLELIYRSCRELVAHVAPDEIALESLIYVRNISSLSKLAQARGAMVAAFAETHKNKIFEYSPNIVKGFVTGYGHADKQAIEKTLGMIFGRAFSFTKHDESDALAIATCHALKHFPQKPTIRKTG